MNRLKYSRIIGADLLAADAPGDPELQVWPDPRRHLALRIDHGRRMCLQARAGGRLAGMGGVLEVYPSVGDAWFLPVDIPPHLVREVVRDCRNLIRLAFDELNLHRIQTLARTEDGRAGKFIKTLCGAWKKALAPDGADMTIYRWLKTETEP